MDRVYILKEDTAKRGRPVDFLIWMVSEKKDMVFEKARILAEGNGSSLSSGHWYEIMVFDNSHGRFLEDYLVSKESGEVKFLKGECRLKASL